MADGGSKTEWPAPRTAYLMTAAVAEDDTESACQLWRELDERGRADVLLALGAQTRNALVTIWAAARQPVALELPPLQDCHCGPLGRAAFGLIFARGESRPGICMRCGEVLVSALCRIHITLARSVGMDSLMLARNCRAIATAREGR